MFFVIVLPTVELNGSPVGGVLITPYTLLSSILPHLESISLKAISLYGPA